jgi:hypothetical protein
MAKKSEDLPRVHLNVEALDCLEPVIECLPQVSNFKDFLVSFLSQELFLDRFKVERILIL